MRDGEELVEDPPGRRGRIVENYVRDPRPPYRTKVSAIYEHIESNE
jgi:hypothetical protein